LKRNVIWPTSCSSYAALWTEECDGSSSRSYFSSPFTDQRVSRPL
jgi:hypothetical protein